jgi:hypothetical protein
MADTSLALTPQARRLPARDARDNGKVLPGGGVGRRRRYACAAGSLWCGTTPSQGFPHAEEIERALADER